MPKPPRDTAQKWLAFGAMVTVAVGVSFASSAFKSHLQKGLPEAGPIERAPLVSSPPQPKILPVEDTDPDDEAPAALDPPTMPPGNAKSSLAAVPAWARNTTPSYAPIHTDAVELLSAGSDPSGTMPRAVVVCRGRRTTYNGDLHLRIAVGGLPEISADGAKQSASVYVTAPLVDLKDGTPIEAILSETRSEGIVEVARMKKTSSEQLQSATDDGELECAALAGTDLQDRIAQDAGRADSALVRLSRLRIDPREVWDLDLVTEQPRAERRVTDLAALVGWDDPRVKTRVATYNAALSGRSHARG